MKLANQREIFFSDEWLSLFCNEYQLIRFPYKESFLNLSFEIKKILGFRIAVSPSFIPYNIYIEHINPDMSISVQYNHEIGLLKQWLKEKPRCKILQFKFGIAQLLFSKAEYPYVNTVFASTEILDANLTEDNIWNNLNSEARNDILNAQRNSSIQKITDYVRVARFISKNDEYKKNLLNYDKLLIALQSDIVQSNAFIYGCFNEDELISCSIFIKSKDSLHYWLNYNLKPVNIRGAHLAIIWEGIKLSRQLNLIFNFDGSMNSNIKKTFKIFGSRTVPYPIQYLYQNKLIQFIHKFFL